MSSTSWEGIFTTIRNLFHIFMFYFLKSTYLYRSRGYFFKNNYFYPIMPLFLSHVAVKIWGLCLVYIVHGDKLYQQNNVRVQARCHSCIFFYMREKKNVQKNFDIVTYRGKLHRLFQWVRKKGETALYYSKTVLQKG